MINKSSSLLRLCRLLFGEAKLDKEALTLCAHELVEVRSITEILRTLDRDGTLDGLPFMPEMVPFCGKRFRISRRAEKTCIDIPGVEVREFRNNDVVLLDDLRCSGANHSGCQRACMLFWKAAWLRPVHDGCVDAQNPEDYRPPVPSQLKTAAEPDGFFCQSTELVRATQTLGRTRRLWKCLRDVWTGTHGVFDAIRLLVVPLFQKLCVLLFGDRYRGGLQKTPVASLDLKPGEWVRVKALEEIIQTLDPKGKNRGLFFSPNMRTFCGKNYRVRSRLDRIIIEGTGKMRELQDTVTLEGVNCKCPTVVGGCPRGELVYWREIWLRRIE